MDSTIEMPSELTADNGAKKLLIGEFHEICQIDCNNCGGDDSVECDWCESGSVYEKIPVSWTTIKAIYAMAAEHLGKAARQANADRWEAWYRENYHHHGPDHGCHGWPDPPYPMPGIETDTHTGQ